VETASEALGFLPRHRLDLCQQARQMRFDDAPDGGIVDRVVTRELMRLRNPTIRGSSEMWRRLWNRSAHPASGLQRPPTGPARGATRTIFEINVLQWAVMRLPIRRHHSRIAV